MNKKAVGVVGAGMAVMMGVAGCSSSSSPDSGEAGGEAVTVFHRWTAGHQEAVESVLESCSDELGIPVDISNVPQADYEVQLPVALSSNNPPDIYALWPGGRAVFQAENGLIAPITDFYNEKIAPTFAEGVNAGATEADGEVYVMPFNVQPAEFYYRTDAFEANGLEEPETWDEFVDVVDTLVDAGDTPIVLATGSGWEPLFWFDTLIMRTAGPEFRERLMLGEESYLDPKVVEAMEHWAELIDAGAFNDSMTSMSWEEMVPFMVDGRADMMFMASFASNNLTTAGLVPGEDFKAFPFPTIDPDVEYATDGAMEGWATTGARDNEEDVHAILECFVSTPEATAYVEDFQVPSPNVEVPETAFAEDVRPFAAGWAAMTQQGVFQQNLELSTAPAVTDVAKRELPRFLANPDDMMMVLEELESASQAAYSE
ncbi:ABC transporter substrate-binding protein [Microbacterium aquimaris]|uniref:ABC transporter substrate-binding protein n=1 Tax=Microbacterium aquimaris TaxID=459816 RepID=UPI002AD4D686|nr:ABC transporter substrate-binding protein [Microbacterium aquimaris]MDZ8275267.1 ABC transporter substrate-binding protein [Microbacterium aquimaris]